MKLKSLFGNKEVNNAGWLISGRIIKLVLSVFVGALTARYLGPSDYGLVNYGSAYVTFFSALCTLGLNSVIIKDFVDNPHQQGLAIGSTLVMRLVSSTMSVLITMGIVFVIDKGEPLTLAVVALCGMGSIFHVFETFNYWFQYKYKSKITAMAVLLAYIVTSAYKIILLILGKNVCWFAFATSVDYIVVALFLYISYKKYGGEKLSFSLSKSKSLFSVSRHYLASSIMVSIYSQTDKLMLKQIVGESEVGFYGIAATMCNMSAFVISAIIDSIYPTILRLKNQDYEAYERKNRQLYAIVFYVSAFISVCFTVFGELIIKILYGEEYLPTVNILKVVSWYTAFSYLGVARNAWIVSEGCQKYLKYMYGCAAVLNVVLNLLLIPHLNGVGAALASLITQFFTSIVLPFAFKDLRPNAKLMLQAIVLHKTFR